MATTITANGINFPDGSASAPSIGGTDTNTGLFTGSDIVGFATGGNERLRITSDGELLVGTTVDNGFKFKVSDGGGYEFAFAPNDSSINSLVNYNRSGGAYVDCKIVQKELQLWTGTSPSERLRIDANGDVMFHNYTDNIGSNSSGEGFEFRRGEALRISRDQGLGLIVNRTSDDGDLITLRRDGSGKADLGIRSNALTFDVAGSERVRIDSSGRLLINASATRASAGGNPMLQIEKNSSELATFLRTDNGNGAAWLALAKSRSSAGAACQAGDNIGAIAFIPHDGTDLNHHAAEIRSYVDTGIGTNDTPGYLTFHTNPGQTTTNERLRITSGGHVNIGGDYTQSTYKAQITGDLLIQKAVAAYDHPQIELYATNNTAHGGAIKFSAMYNTKYQLAKIRATGGSGSPNDSGGALHFYTGDGGEKLILKANGDLDLKDNNLIVASGYGISFADTSQASGVTSELLDDYEEGTFTPSFSTGLTGSSYTYQHGVYTKIGRKVSWTIIIYISTGNDTTSSSVINIEGFPFTSLNSAPAQGGGGHPYYQDLFYNSANGFSGIQIDNSTQLRLYKASDGTYLAGTDVDGDRQVRLSGFYFTS